MKVQKRNGDKERHILIGMIVSRGVLARIAPKWKKEGLFRSKWSNYVGGWAVNYFRKYDKPPRRHIEGLFRNWAEDNTDKESVELIEKFLESLSEEYVTAKKINVEFLLDTAASHFNRVAGEQFLESYQGHLDNGDFDKAETLRTGFNKVDLGSGAGIDVLRDTAAIEESFKERGDPLIKYKGALRNFFGDSFCRDSFVSIMAPEKRGKTWWLLDFAWNGMLQKNKVAFFAVGDMSQNQMLRRFMVRAAQRPWKIPPKDKPPIRWPTSIVHHPDYPNAETELKDLHFKDPLDPVAAKKACALITAGSKEPRLRLSVHPNNSISVLGVASILNGWSLAGWTPDIVVIDYADILAPISGTVDSRDQIDQTWKGLRALSQSLHCLVITATQSDAASYKAETLDMSNFSNDKRKMAHVTGMLGLNQTTEEKLSQTMRLNWIVLREEEFVTDRCVYVAQCLGLANPAVRSTF